MVLTLFRPRLPIFPRRQWWAGRLCLPLSLWLHLLLMFYCIKAFSNITPSAASVPEFSVTDTIAEAAMIEIIDIPEQVSLPGVPENISREAMQARMRTGIDDNQAKSPQEQMRDLKELAKAAELIPEQSIKEIASFLSPKKSGQYVPRTYYKDELNRNFNMAHAEVVRACAFEDEKGDFGYTITLQDWEREHYTFTFKGSTARELDWKGLSFNGKQLSRARTDDSFELKGAKITDIQRWKRPDRPNRRMDVKVTMADPKGQARVISMDQQQHRPFIAERMRFLRNINGESIYRDSKETLHTNGFDTMAATIYAIERLPDENGKKVIKAVLLDPKGERMVQIIKGDAAIPYLRQAEVLKEGSVLNTIYREAVMHMLPEMMKQQREAEKRNREIRKQREKK